MYGTLGQWGHHPKLTDPECIRPIPEIGSAVPEIGSADKTCLPGTLATTLNGELWVCFDSEDGLVPSWKPWKPRIDPQWPQW